MYKLISLTDMIHKDSRLSPPDDVTCRKSCIIYAQNESVYVPVSVIASSIVTHVFFSHTQPVFELYRGLWGSPLVFFFYNGTGGGTGGGGHELAQDLQ